MSGEVTTVADLTAEHHGWMIRVAEPEPLRRREFVLGKGFKVGVRRWTYDGTDWVGLCDDSGRAPGIVGTERRYEASTPCSLVRPISPAAKRAARASGVRKDQP